eukprot:1718058-Rhodomonas_salina.1
MIQSAGLPTHPSREVCPQMAEALFDSLPAPGRRNVDLEGWIIVEVLDLLGGDLRESDVVVPLHVPGDLDEMIFDAG